MRKILGVAKKPLIWIFGIYLFMQSGLEGLFNNWSTTYLMNTSAMTNANALFALTMLVLGMTVMRLLLGKFLRINNQIYFLIGGVFLVIVVLLGAFLLSPISYPMVVYIGLFLIGAGLAAGFPVMIGLISDYFTQTTGSAIGFALFLALSGNSILNYTMGRISGGFGIRVFPIFLIALLAIQMIVIIVNKNIINKQN